VKSEFYVYEGQFKMNLKSRQWRFFVALDIKYTRWVLYYIKKVV